MAEITGLLVDARRGDADAEAQLLPLVYAKLRELARKQLRKLGEQDTLNPTALVHEAYLKLLRGDDRTYQNRLHFYAVSANAMRFILIDHVRKHCAERRGGGQKAVTLDEAWVASESSPELLLELNDALEKLGRLDERLVQIVEYLFFGGLTQAEAAEQLGVTERTVRREWTKAKAWLTLELQPNS
ncbi:MAG: ECF-type sigma factor [Pseudomonadota bacterium]